MWFVCEVVVFYLFVDLFNLILLNSFYFIEEKDN